MWKRSQRVGVLLDAATALEKFQPAVVAKYGCGRIRIKQPV
jgi:hypothetical protein